jgi:uncharacterized protein (TIGR02231 family)
MNPCANPLRLLPVALLNFPVLLWGAPVDSHVSAVTVYADRAVVTRSATVNLVPGANDLVFDPLPANLADQSLQFSGHGTASATILDVNAQTVYVDVTPNSRVLDLEEQVRALQRQTRALDDRAAVLGDERDFVKRMLQASTGTVIYPLGADAAHGGGSAARPTLDEWEKLYSYSEETLGKIATEVESLDGQREDLKAKQAALELQLNELHGARGKKVKRVTVRVAATTEGTLDVSLKYALPGANWVPSYDARLHAADRVVELTYNGIVRNGTGEDWNDIALTLSTARPSLGGGAPELWPWVVDVAQPRVELMSKARPASSLRDVAGSVGVVSRQFLEDTGGSNANAPEAVQSYATVEANATSATFRIPATVSVAANNSSQKVSISSAKLAANLQYQSTPRMMEAAFLTAEAVNTTDFPFLAGAMNTFLDDTFIAASRLKTVMPGEKIELQLGVDEGIAIKRKLVNRFAENTGLTGNGRRVTYEFLVSVANNKKTPEHLVFKEALPVSRNEKIVVSLITPEEKDVGTKESPKEVTREEDGSLVWRIDLRPAEKREVTLKFSIEYPADVNVSGLE